MMISQVMDPHRVHDSEPSTAAEQAPPVFPQSNPLCREMNLPVLAAQCLLESEQYRRGEPSMRTNGAERCAPAEQAVHTPSVTSDQARVAAGPDDLTAFLGPLPVSALASGCMREIESSRPGAACAHPYSLELLRRATVGHDAVAWEALQQCLSVTVLCWLRCHPLREQASRFERDENYVAQTFARLWLAQAHHERLEFRSLAAALSYLRACLNGVILDTLRCYQRSKELPLPEPGWLGEPLVADEEGSELWESIQHLLPTQRERRVAYLLLHCGLKPRDIVRYCPQEFGQVREIYRLRRNILLRLQRHADQIRWRLQRVSGG